MKNLFKALTAFYILFPFILVPLMQAGFIQPPYDSRFYLCGIVLYFLSVWLVAAGQQIILLIPVLFFCWFWYTCGFDLHGFSFFLFICIFSGATFFKLAQKVKYFVHRVLPENKEAQEYERKIEKMYAQLNLYKQMHPSAAITPDIIDSIRNQVFFT